MKILLNITIRFNRIKTLFFIYIYLFIHCLIINLIINLFMFIHLFIQGINYCLTTLFAVIQVLKCQMEWLKIVLVSVLTVREHLNITFAPSNVFYRLLGFADLVLFIFWNSANLSLVSMNFGFSYADMVRMCCDISLRQVSALAIQTCFVCSSSKLHQVMRSLTIPSLFLRTTLVSVSLYFNGGKLQICVELCNYRSCIEIIRWYMYYKCTFKILHTFSITTHAFIAIFCRGDRFSNL